MGKKSISREELFEKIPVWRAIFTLTIPMIIGSIVSIIYNLSDTFFVGMLNDPLQNAAVTLAAPAMTLFYAITNLFGTGASSLMSRCMGIKDTENVKRASATGLYSGLFFATLLMLASLLFHGPILRILGADETTIGTTGQYFFWTVSMGAIPGIMTILFGTYLRAEGQAMRASIGQISGCLLNIILDPFFILPFGLNMGVAGAGLATFLSNCVACTYFIVLIFRQRNRTLVCVHPKYITFNKFILSNIFVVGVPGVFQNNLNVIGMTIMNNIIALYGANAIASVGIANKVNQLPLQVIFGFSQGVMPLIGYNYANGNHARMKETIRKTFTVSMSTLLVMSCLFIFNGKNLIRFFMDNEEIMTIGARFLMGFGISLPFMCLDFMVVGISQSFGKGIHALSFSFLRKLFLEIPFLFVLNALFGIYGIAYAQCMSEIIMAIVALWVMRSLLGTKKEKSLA